MSIGKNRKTFGL